MLLGGGGIYAFHLSGTLLLFLYKYRSFLLGPYVSSF
jgi:hypothetical protein